MKRLGWFAITMTVLLAAGSFPIRILPAQNPRTPPNDQGRGNPGPGEPFDYSPANIEARTHRSVLPNGAKVAMLSKKSAGGGVSAHMTFYFGDEQSLANHAFESLLASAMLSRGTKKHTGAQLTSEFARLNTRWSVTGAPTQVIVTLQTFGGNLAGAIKLLAEVLRDPSFAESEWQELKRQWSAFVAESKQNPQRIAQLNLSRHLNPYPKGDVRYIPTDEEQEMQVSKVTLDSIKKFYADFIGGSNGNIAVVGDFDQQEIDRILRETLGSWKSPAAFKRVPMPHHDVVPVRQSLDSPVKVNAVLLEGLSLPMRDDDPDYASVLLVNHLLGGFQGSRLALRLTKKDRIVFGISSAFSASPFDRSATFNISSICNVDDLSRAEAAIREELDKAIKSGFTSEEVAAAKSSWRQSQQAARAQDEALASRLANYLFIGRTMSWDAAMDKKVSGVTPAMANAALKKYIIPSKFSVFRVGRPAKDPLQ